MTDQKSPSDADVRQEQQIRDEYATLVQLITFKAWMFAALGLGLVLLAIFAILWAISGT